MKTLFIESVKTVSLRQIYNYIFDNYHDSAFIQFMSYHIGNYEPQIDYFTVSDKIKPFYILPKESFKKNKTHDILLKYNAISHLLIDLRNHFKHDKEILHKIYTCIDNLEETFLR